MEDPFAFQSENSAHSGVTRGCSDEAEYCTYNDRRIHNGFTRSSIQRPYTSSFRNLFNSPVRHRNQFFHGSTRDPKLVTGVSGYVHSASSLKQVTLYKWYLIRVVKDCPQNGIIDDEQVAVGGYTTPDLLDCDKFRTAPIESRLEKCKLRTVDGLDVLLMGTIDEQCTNDNGFPFQVIHLFLHGFPFNWNHIISISNRKPSVNMHILPASNTEDCASKEKMEKPDSECPVVQVDGTETGKSSLLEQEQSLSRTNSRRESSLRDSKRVRHDLQPATLSKKSICCQLSTEDKTEKLFTVVESQEKFNILKESKANLSSGAPNKSLSFKSSDMDSHVQIVQEDKLTASGKEFVGSQDNPNILKGTEANLSPGVPSKFVEKEAPRPKSSDMDSDVQVDHENIWTDSGCELRRTKSPNFSAFHVGKGPVKTEKNVSRKYKSKYFKKQIDGGSSHDEVKLIESTGTVKIKENNANQTIDKLPNSKGDADNRTDNQEVEQSSWNSVHLEQLIDNCTPVKEGSQSHILEFADIGCKRRRPSKSDTNSRNVYSQASAGILCDKGTVMDGISNNSDGKELKDVTDCELRQEITPKRRRGKDPVKTEENVPQRYKRTKESKEKIDCVGSLDEAKLVESTGTVNIGDCNANLTIGRFPDSEGDADLRAAKQEIEQSSQNKVHLEQLINNSTPVERTPEIEIPISEFAVTGSKKRRGRPRKSITIRSRNSRNAYSEASRDILCDEATVMDGRKNNSDVKIMIHCEELHQAITPTSPPLDKACKGTDETVHAEEENLAEFGILHFQKPVSSSSAENIPFSSGDSHINNDVIRVEKAVNKTKTKREGKGKSRTGDANPMCNVSNGLVCNEITMKDGLKLKLDDISEIVDGDLNPVAVEIEHDMSAEHDTELGVDLVKETIDKDKDSLQTQKNGTERTTSTLIGKRQCTHSKIPPPLPPSRVQTTPEEVSKAFGLKTSRSGRILVPPLAHWCNQTIAYDWDGGIIAIFDGSADKKDDDGSCSFKPPEQPEAIRTQKKLCNAVKKLSGVRNVGTR